MCKCDNKKEKLRHILTDTLIKYSKINTDEILFQFKSNEFHTEIFRSIFTQWNNFPFDNRQQNISRKWGEI